MPFTFYSFNPIHREEDAYKNAKKCLHKRLTPTMYSCKFPGKSGTKISLPTAILQWQRTSAVSECCWTFSHALTSRNCRVICCTCLDFKKLYTQFCSLVRWCTMELNMGGSISSIKSFHLKGREKSWHWTLHSMHLYNKLKNINTRACFKKASHFFRTPTNNFSKKGGAKIY